MEECNNRISFSVKSTQIEHHYEFSKKKELFVYYLVKHYRRKCLSCVFSQTEQKEKEKEKN